MTLSNASTAIENQTIGAGMTRNIKNTYAHFFYMRLKFEFYTIYI